MPDEIVGLSVDAFEKLRRDHHRLNLEIHNLKTTLRRNIQNIGGVGLPGSDMWPADAREDIAAGGHGNFRLWPWNNDLAEFAGPVDGKEVVAYDFLHQ